MWPLTFSLCFATLVSKVEKTLLVLGAFVLESERESQLGSIEIVIYPTEL